MAKGTLTGRAVASETGKGFPGLVTSLTITPEKPLKLFINSSDEQPVVHIAGRHHVLADSRIRVVYEIDTRKMYWGDSYSILDSKGRILHSDIAG